MAKLLITLRLTGQVSNGVARDLLAQLRSLTDACDAAGVEVRPSVDVRLDPEPAAKPVKKPEPKPEPAPAVRVAKATGAK